MTTQNYVVTIVIAIDVNCTIHAIPYFNDIKPVAHPVFLPCHKTTRFSILKMAEIPDIVQRKEQTVKFNQLRLRVHGRAINCAASKSGDLKFESRRNSYFSFQFFSSSSTQNDVFFQIFISLSAKLSPIE